LDGRRDKLALHNLIEAHIQAYDKITELDNVDVDEDGLPKRVGFGHLMTHVIPAKPKIILGKRILNKNNDQAAENAPTHLHFVNQRVVIVWSSVQHSVVYKRKAIQLSFYFQ
jgi:hypothetical protein